MTADTPLPVSRILRVAAILTVTFVGVATVLSGTVLWMEWLLGFTAPRGEVAVISMIAGAFSAWLAIGFSEGMIG